VFNLPPVEPKRYRVFRASKRGAAGNLDEFSVSLGFRAQGHEDYVAIVKRMQTLVDAVCASILLVFPGHRTDVLVTRPDELLELVVLFDSPLQVVDAAKFKVFLEATLEMEEQQ